MITFYALLLSIFIFADPCYAYIDPGSGTILWQLLAAGLIGGTLYIKKLIRYITQTIQRFIRK